jgi:hypothetical protein
MPGLGVESGSLQGKEPHIELSTPSITEPGPEVYPFQKGVGGCEEMENTGRGQG